MSSTDYTRLLDRLLPDAGGEDTVRMRVGVVSAVNVNGTLDVIVSGQTAPGVSQLDSSVAAVGDVVQMISYRGSLLVIGTVGVTSAAGVDPVARADSTSSTSAVGTTETVVHTTPSFTYKAGRAYTVLIGGGVAYSASDGRAVWNVRKGTTTSGTVILTPLRTVNGSTSGTEAMNLTIVTQFVIGASDVTTQLALTTSSLSGGGTTVTMVGQSTYPRHFTILPAGYAAAWGNAAILS